MKLDMRDSNASIPYEEYLTSDMKCVKVGVKVVYQITDPAE